MYPVTELESIVSFANNIAASLFGGILGFVGLRAHDGIKLPARYRSPVSTKIEGVFKKGGDDTLVWFLRIRPKNVGVIIYGGKFGKIGLHICAASLTFGSSCGIKTHSVKAQDIVSM